MDQEAKTGAGSLLVSCDAIQQNLVGQTAQGTFTLEVGGGGTLQGCLYHTDPRLECSPVQFQGERIEISYCFDGSALESGETVKGSIALVTDRGEQELEYAFTCPGQVLESSLGEIRNLFHFTNLARTSFEEAGRFFVRKEFAGLLKKADGDYLQIYRGLSDEENVQRVEEFLQAIHKKSAPEFIPEKTELIFTNIEENSKEELEIAREGWGYTRLTVRTEGDFLAVEKNLYTDDDFMGNRCGIVFYLLPGKMHQGINLGRLIISHAYGRMEIVVRVEQIKHHRRRVAIEKRRRMKELGCELTALYVDFRGKRLGADRWRKETRGLLEKMQQLDERNPVTRLFAAHLYISQEKYYEAKWQLDRAAKHIQPEQEPVIYAYYLYLSGLLTEDEEYGRELTEKIEELYYTHEENWQIAWLMLYLSGELRTHADRKWEFLKEVFRQGCTSPVMYTEAVLLLNYQPTLLMELTETELRILRFGQKKRMLSDGVKGVLQYLSLREKEYSPNLYVLLRDICEEEENQEMLRALCSLLIKGNKTGREYFPWYEKGIFAGLKITRLYEYYMLSLDREKKTDISRMVLMYFSYQSSLSYEYAAYLYRYIHENREENQELYLAYAPGIERFVLKQLYAGKINDDLGYLYEQILLPGMLTQDNAGALVKLMFTACLSVEDKDTVKVVVVHDKLKEEATYEVNDGKVNLVLYTDRYILFREDRQGNRFCFKPKEAPRFYLSLKKAAPLLAFWVKEDMGLAMHRCLGRHDWNAITRENVEQYCYLSTCSSVREEEKQDIFLRLLDYYYDADEPERMDEALESCVPYSVTVENRKKLIHYLVVRGYAEKAYRFIRIYGAENMEPKALVRVSTCILEEGIREKQLLWITYEAFLRGKYNVCMLQYLIEEYQGTSKAMRDIYQAAVNFDVDAYSLCERLLKQLLFSGAYIGYEAQVFKSYVAGGARSSLEAAFLVRMAEGYMLENKVIDEYFIRDIGRVSKREVELPFLVHLAYLRYYALHPEERQLADEGLLARFLREAVVEKGVWLPYLQEIQGIPGGELLMDKTLLSYQTNPGTSVVLHYLKNRDDEEEEVFVREEMKEVYPGTYARDFILFAGEQMQYYITEEQENREQLTESGVLQRDEHTLQDEESRYHLLNLMAASEKLGDNQTLEELLEEYWKEEFIADKVFELT